MGQFSIKEWRFNHLIMEKDINENETTDYVKELEKVYNEISKEIKKSKKWSDSHKKELYKELHEEMWDIISPGTKSAPKKFNWKSTEVYKEVSTIGPAGKNNIVPQLWDIIKESVNEARFDAEKALHWHEPSKVIPEMVAAALIKSIPYDFYELMDLLEEYNISFELETAGSRRMEPNSTPSQIKQAVKYMNWDAFQDDNEIIQLQDYIEEIIGPF